MDTADAAVLADRVPTKTNFFVGERQAFICTHLITPVIMVVVGGWVWVFVCVFVYSCVCVCVCLGLACSAAVLAFLA